MPNWGGLEEEEPVIRCTLRTRRVCWRKVNYTWNWANLVARPLCLRLRIPLFVCGWPNRAKPMHLGAQEQRPKQQQQQREQQEKHQRRRLTFSKGRQCHPCSVNGIYRWEQQQKKNKKTDEPLMLLLGCCLCEIHYLFAKRTAKVKKRVWFMLWLRILSATLCSLWVNPKIIEVVWGECVLVSMRLARGRW